MKLVGSGKLKNGVDKGDAREREFSKKKSKREKKK